MDLTETASVQLDAQLGSGAVARQLLAGWLDGWAPTAMSDDAALCTSELVANAVLHCRAPFTFAVRRIPGGLRLEVIDACPHQAPLLVPATGTAADLTANSATGRGLRIIAHIATRWGWSTGVSSKAVWVELSSEGTRTPSPQPFVQVGHHAAASEEDALTFRYLGVPVRAAVASGIHIDELTRRLQLDALASDGDVRNLLSLLDRSAPVRLSGRHAALRASSEDRQRFDFELTTTADAHRAVRDLNLLLAEVHTPDGSHLPSQEVQDLRAWLVEETARQRAGEPPSACPLDA